MPNRAVIRTEKAPRAIGTYSQAIKINNTVYLSGQIPLLPETMEIVGSDIKEQVHQVFRNLSAVCEEAGGNLGKIVKLNIFLTDLSHFETINSIMASLFSEPFPARAVIGVKSLPRDALVEMDAVMVV